MICFFRIWRGHPIFIRSSRGTSAKLQMLVLVAAVYDLDLACYPWCPPFPRSSMCLLLRPRSCLPLAVSPLLSFCRVFAATISAFLATPCVPYRFLAATTLLHVVSSLPFFWLGFVASTSAVLATRCCFLALLLLCPCFYYTAVLPAVSAVPFFCRVLAVMYSLNFASYPLCPPFRPFCMFQLRGVLPHRPVQQRMGFQDDHYGMCSCS